MKSMTGFGKAIRETKAYQLDIEIKSVNQRFLDVQIRSPKILNFIENDFRQLIKQQLSRGLRNGRRKTGREHGRIGTVSSRYIEKCT